MDAISQARSGIVNAMSNAGGAGANLSNAFSHGGDPAAAAVDQVKAANALRASLASLKTSSRLFTALLDIKV
ncbi:MAG TPA: hypothetical protein VHZ26_12790 [Caulobacteraceae bacterium]|nr:hypothetical protein [Caulobacteraceae bacterium]